MNDPFAPIDQPTRFNYAAHARTYWYTVVDYLTDLLDHNVDPRSPQAVLVGIDRMHTQSDVDALYRQCSVASYLPRADFTLFNEAYHTASDHDVCGECTGTSGKIYSEYQGDPPMGGMVDFFDACAECLGAGLCPGCMQPLFLSFDQSALPDYTYRGAPDYHSGAPNFYTIDGYSYALAAIPFEGFVCLVCGWSYDPDRHYDREADYYYDDGSDDYPAFDADQLFH